MASAVPFFVASPPGDSCKVLSRFELMVDLFFKGIANRSGKG
jgi:hypothetical protein